MDHLFTPIRRKTFYANAYLYFALALFVIFLGFFPSYFGKITSASRGHHVHGMTATLWLLMLIIQPFLYRLDKITWHRRIGKISFILVPLIVVSGFSMVHAMLNSGTYPPGVPYQIAFIDFILIPAFFVFYVLAIYHRKQIDHHARYMACTVFLPLLAGVLRVLFRFSFIDSFSKSLNCSFILVELVLLLLLLDDKRSGKIRTPYVIALVIHLAVHGLMNFAHQWGWWRSWMDTYASL